jgi:hypothetical protein
MTYFAVWSCISESSVALLKNSRAKMFNFAKAVKTVSFNDIAIWKSKFSSACGAVQERAYSDLIINLWAHFSF